MAQDPEEVLDIYEDEDGNEFILVDGEFMPFDSNEFETVEEPKEPETFDVYEDEDGNEYIIVDGEKVPFDADEYDVVEAEEDIREYNPLAYDSIQAATDVANDLAREGGSIVREGAAFAGELKEAMDDINSLFNPKSWLK